MKLRNLTRIDSGRVLVASQDRIGNTGRVSRVRIRRQRKPFCKKKGKGVSNRPPVCRRRAARRRR